MAATACINTSSGRTAEIRGGSTLCSNTKTGGKKGTFYRTADKLGKFYRIYVNVSYLGPSSDLIQPRAVDPVKITQIRE